MKKELRKLFGTINERYGSEIAPEGVNYVDVDLSSLADSMGLGSLKEALKHACAIIPLKQPRDGMKVMIDGRTFVRYSQLDTGIAVPDFVARAAGLARKPYVANDSMILNC